MTKEEYRAGAEDVIYLAACMVNGDKPDAERVRRMDLGQLYRTADRHLLTGIVGYALEAAGIRDPAFVQAKSKAIRKVVLFNAERAEVLAELEKAGIWYMPVKGSVLHEYYPQIGMRQMADNDILYDASRTSDVRSIMEGLGFETDQNYGRGIHDHFFKPPVCNFEMHRSLFGMVHDERLFEYYRDVKDRLLLNEGTAFGYHFSHEDFYIYIIAHEYKHYSVGGTGLRSLLDTYVYLRKVPMDMEYVAGETEKLGITDFETANCSLATHLFGEEPLTLADQEMLDYILSSGTYGTRAHSVNNKVKKLGGGVRGKMKYLIGRIFLPMNSVQSAYPFFYRHKILLPFLVFYRMGKALTSRRKMVRAELKALAKREG